MPLNDTKPSVSTAWERSYRRLAGTGQVERGDVVVFNFPEGDTVVMERAAESYYQMLLSNEFGRTEAERRKNIAENSTVVTRPLDKKENYIKRCVAVGGDTLQIINGRVYTNGELETEIPNKQYYYDVYNLATGRVQSNMLLRDTDVERYSDTTRYHLTKSLGYAGEMLIPHRVKTGWTLDDFGPVWVPKAGESIELNDETIAMYGRCITAYEHRSLKIERSADGVVYYIDGEPATHYTFLMDYYFMMGDNRHASLDSRFWGFVPEDHIVGRASYVWFSRDPETGDIRWDRMFKSIE
jgi:signal peptidase I